MTTALDEKALFAEIGRSFRRRFIGVYLSLAMAALFSLGIVFSVPMMHSGHPTAAMGTIVAVEKDDAGETWMTSEFTDADGVTHHDRETRGYHYAPGEPKVGQHIEYFYERSARTGDMHMYPRADRILQIAFGIPTAILLLMAGLVAWLVLRQRALRRRLVRIGRREIPQAPTVRQKSFVLPAGNRMPSVAMWRLEARYYETTRSEFVPVHSDWQHSVAPELNKASALVPILIDPERPRRYWLPVGSLVAAK